MTQLVITFISIKYYIMYLFLRRFVRFRLWPGALLISHISRFVLSKKLPSSKFSTYVEELPLVLHTSELDISDTIFG